MRPEATVDRLFELLCHEGGDAYFGEAVTKLEHSLQAAHLARQAGAGEEEVIAALLHDIGHLLDGGQRHEVAGVIDHDEIGGRYLGELGFSAKVVELVAGHVDAKRYLTAANPAYASRLSPASATTLELQGGPMLPEEAREFANDALLLDKLRIRSWDEQAKVPGLAVPGLDSYRALLVAHLSDRAETASRPRS